MSYNIPIFKPNLPKPELVNELYKEIYDCGVVSNFGKQCQEFERIASEYLGNENIVAVASCDVGLKLAIASLNLPKGSKVILPSFTFTSTANAAMWNNLTPIWADIDPETFNIDPKSVEKHINEAELVIATGIFGNPIDYYDLYDAIHENSVDKHLIVDAAHCYGSKAGNVKVGDGLDLEIFSFSGTKLVTCGEGGIVACQSKEQADKIRLLRGYGFLGDYNCQALGVNGKISEFNAAVGTLTLPTIDKAVARRHEIVDKYKELFALNGMEFGYQKINKDNLTTYKDFAILCSSNSQREAIRNNLEFREIQTKAYFLPLHLTDYYKNLTSLPNTMNVYERILCLPCFNSMTDEQIKKVVMMIKDVY
jgi:dTDP-4-amino-4,6-dideoxygalactose transaminase